MDHGGCSEVVEPLESNQIQSLLQGYAVAGDTADK